MGIIIEIDAEENYHLLSICYVKNPFFLKVKRICIPTRVIVYEKRLKKMSFFFIH